MMGRNIKMAAVAFTAIITLTGCGTKLYDMTDEEHTLSLIIQHMLLQNTIYTSRMA